MVIHDSAHFAPIRKHNYPYVNHLLIAAISLGARRVHYFAGPLPEPNPEKFSLMHCAFVDPRRNSIHAYEGIIDTSRAAQSLTQHVDELYAARIKMVRGIVTVNEGTTLETFIPPFDEQGKDVQAVYDWLAAVKEFPPSGTEVISATRKGDIGDVLMLMAAHPPRTLGTILCRENERHAQEALQQLRQSGYHLRDWTLTCKVENDIKSILDSMKF